LHYISMMHGQRDVRIPEFFPLHPVQHLAYAIMSPSPRILNLHDFPKKTSFHPRTSLCQCFSLMVTLQSTDWACLKWLRQRYTVYGFRFHGSLRGRQIADKTDNIQTLGGTWSLRILLALSDADYCMILRVFGEWQYPVIMLIGSPNPSPDT